MWIDRMLLPTMIEAVQAAIDEAKAECEAGPDGELCFDPNDIFILDVFVLSVLEDHRDTGFDSDDMLDKGFGFLLGLLPGYLMAHRDSLTAAQRERFAALLAGTSNKPLMSF